MALLQLEGRALLRLGASCGRHGSVCTSTLRPFRPAAGAHSRPHHRRPQLCTLAAACTEPVGATTEQHQPAPQPAEQPPHVSVLLEEVLGFFEGQSVATYVDGTLGAAGHAGEMLRRHPEMTTLVGFDLDTTAHAIAAARLEGLGARVVPVQPRPGPGGRLSISSAGAGPAPPASQQLAQPTAYIVHSNFGAMGGVLPQLEGGRLRGAVDAVLLDLGMSSMQVGEGLECFV
jgi:hypothetical protein